LPSEEVLLLKRAATTVGPHATSTRFLQARVLAPEYGGDGKTAVFAPKRRSRRSLPGALAPTTWCCITSGHSRSLPQRPFIAFHGSWNRAPYAQGGYNVVYQAVSGDKASGQCEIFADGFAGADKSPAKRRTGRPAWPLGPTAPCMLRTMCRGGSIASFTAAARTPPTQSPCPAPASPNRRGRSPRSRHGHPRALTRMRAPIPPD